ncbi:prepilin-type N-terminal cleavage/methylation domain-containing protein [Sodalis sp. dw_96]|uniref:prepilin-type N-terminal cleavage/methylation domain-containing protein n=1 Tax=Sodalis sp. dw_96 TaxID=2719794 RepID=UPI001BD3C36D|nr:prepilin-type N-terminal cleavage/methylation domain-containing protein [Sodalis sp. dw_96]
MHNGDERGLGMAEAMVTVLLFSMIALALMDYLQALKQSQDGLVRRQQALTFAHQGLELYRLEGMNFSLDLPPGWRLHRRELPRGPACRRVTVEVRIPSGRGVTLSEWFCRESDGNVAAHGR